jgi:acetyl esterase/lipase
MRFRAKPDPTEDPGASAPAGSAGRRLDLPAFLDVLAGPEPAASGETFLIEQGGGLPLPVQILDTPPGGAAGTPVVFVFHGALDQSRRVIPAFAGRFLTRKSGRFATVISLADPALGIDPALKLAWFAACEGTDTPGAIEALAAGVAARLNPSRVVFTGGSAGAHAALRHARALPGSVAVLVNPRMRVRPSHYWQDYVRLCWPEAGTRPPDLGVRVPDIAGLAAAPDGGSTTVYLLNALDAISLRLAAEFLAARGTLDDILLQVEHWPGFKGHSYPQPAWADWVRIAAQAPDISVADLAAQKAAGRQPDPGRPARRAAARPPAPGGFDAADIHLADRLAATAE